MSTATQVPTAPPSKQGGSASLTVVIPKPETSDQLEQLLYRYRAIIQEPEHNKYEIQAIEEVFSNVSNDQDVFLNKLHQLRTNIQKDLKYDEELLKKQVISLQLLSKELDIPVNLVEELSDVVKENGGTQASIIVPVKLSLDFEQNIKNLSLIHI